ncbi:hypothetical protein [Nocardioides marinisabuli]|nr:hypothetical protein [Nocardioides marinisabuli]
MASAARPGTPVSPLVRGRNRELAILEVVCARCAPRWWCAGAPASG